MLLKTLIFISILLSALPSAFLQSANKRLVCYYDVESYTKTGLNKLNERHLDKALVHCTHLVYGFAHLNAQTFNITPPLQFPNPPALKQRFPHLKIYLSLGGDKDYDNANPMKYVRFLEMDRISQYKFINNTADFLKLKGFDGLDLAMALPRNEPRKDDSMAMFWNDVTKVFSSNSQTDAIKQQYTKFVSDLKHTFNFARLELTMTVLPNVNSTWFFDISKLHNDFQFINLFAFDFNTPERNPKEADYSAPLHFQNEQNRLSYANVDFQIDYWLNNGCPAHKLNLGIATYGRAWKLTIQSGLSGRPIVEDANGPAHVVSGKQNAGGLISWTDICFHLPPPRRRGGVLLRKVFDNYGNYAFHEADANNNNGFWISFDDPDFAVSKTKYAKDKELGGITLYDLTNDDFRGRCMRKEYPILQAIRSALEIRMFEPAVTYASVVKRF